MSDKPAEAHKTEAHKTEAARMEAPIASPLSSHGAASRLLAHWTAGVTTALLLLLALVLLARRTSGELWRPLDFASLLAAGLVLASLGALLRVGIYAAGRRQFVDGLVALSVLLAAAAISLPETHAGALVCLWLPVAGAEAAWWTAALVRRRRRLVVDSSPRRQPPGLSASTHQQGDAQSAKLVEEQTPADVSQQIVRCGSGDTETITCRLRGRFAARQKSLNLHVAFCPPLSCAPEITVRQIDGPPAKIEAALSQPYGARLEAKLAQTPYEPVEILVEAVAQAAALANEQGNSDAA